MLSIFKSATDKETVRSVHVYFSSDAFIVAATHKNHDGVYFEQPDAKFFRGIPSEYELGQSFRTAFDQFSIRSKDLRSNKKTDWPAYKASGLGSVKQFEESFRFVYCSSLNSSNSLMRASTAHASDPLIELSISFNPLLQAEVVGSHLLRLVQTAKVN